MLFEGGGQAGGVGNAGAAAEAGAFERGRQAGLAQALLPVQAVEKGGGEGAVEDVAGAGGVADNDRKRRLGVFADAVKRDRAMELEKTQLEDRLREMKIAETRLRMEYDAQLLKFRTWKQEHANEIAKPENDPDVKKWMQEMAALRPRIPGLAY